MDVYDFVNSKDIREYLRSIEYKFGSLEAAWLIAECKKLSLVKKKAAWLELIDTMPDCPVIGRMNCNSWDSLHGMLKEYIAAVEKVSDEFFQESAEGEFVYRYSYLYHDDVSWTEEFDKVFNSYAACYESLRKDIESLDETYFKDGGTGIVKYVIKKQSLKDTDIQYELEFNGDYELDYIGRSNHYEDWISNVLYNSFEGMWFSFPTPFKKGDIVWMPKADGFINWDCDGGFVLDYLATWETPEYMKTSGDYTDMIAGGYFVNPNGTVYHEVAPSYMDLEYYEGPYKMNERILPALSRFVKGELHVDLLMCVYRKVLLDLAADDIMLKSWYSSSLLEELGIE